MSAPTLIFIFFIVANLPWLNERVFCVYRLHRAKRVIVRLVETIVLYIISLLIAVAAELQFSGDIYPQTWEFFTVTFCMFLVLAVPGVIYRYQWLAMGQQQEN
ncbi:hypothetical protein A9Q92_00640 [Methylophaga sp. 42_8_T64]|nr:hypothetical protein A9Q78_07935 [Methylophaga sp. 41_12_T18]OUR89796.1 hypothetical protein A9Q92_00640 [Methylophaga sp. 42_8_T64]